MSRRKFDMVVTEGGRVLDVQYENGDNFKVMASSETGRLGKGHRASTTWRWEFEGKLYRVQVQITEV